LKDYRKLKSRPDITNKLKNYSLISNLIIFVFKRKHNFNVFTSYNIRNYNRNYIDITFRNIIILCYLVLKGGLCQTHVGVEGYYVRYKAF